MKLRTPTLFGCLLLLAVAGCTAPKSTTLKSNASSFFPLGIYGVGETNDLSTVKQAGFNLVTGPVSGDYLDAAGRAGLKVLGSPGTSAGPAFDPAAARQTVSRFDAHPALWGWYLVDEPDLNWISPDDVRQANSYLKSLHPRKPTALVLYQGSSGLDYANIADLTMIDRYPIPWAPLASFGQHVRMARLAVGKQPPLIAVIQAFDWSKYPENLPGEKDLRPPTYEEIRCMTYSALAERATGLFYYIFKDSRWSITEHPATWSALQQVVREVNDRLPLFQAEHLWWPKDHEYAEPSLRFNAALASSITPVLLRVRQGNAQVSAGDYLLTVNTTPHFHVYSVTLPFTSDAARPTHALPPAKIPVLGEDRFLTVQKGWISDAYEPYSIHIYGPLPAPASSAKP